MDFAQENIDDISIERFNDDGKKIVEQTDKAILTRAAWTTIVFKYREWDEKKEAWGESKARIERFRKLNGAYRSQSKFNISSGKQARQLADILYAWFPEDSKE